MGKLAEQVRAEKTRRDEARRRFETRLANVKNDLEAKGIGSRIAGKLGEDAKEALDQAIEIADENRGVVAGTVAALMVWFMRNPIIAAIDKALGGDAQPEVEDDHGNS